MLFNSIDFAVFLPIVFILYWFVTNKNLKLQNLLIVLASYVFYAWWDWRFLSLILISTLVDYLVGRQLSIENNQSRRKLLLWTSVSVNIGLLGFFKYYNFFIENFITAFSLFGTEIKASSLNIILPVGISFYTFQTLSYTIDVYKRKMETTKNFIAFAAFVSFFPQLVAGPIERATHLLPQFFSKRTFDYSKAADGMRQILWGLFKKIVIADNCAKYVILIFNNSKVYPGSTLLIGALFFTFQIYCDFSGYSDIAIGTARLFGFDLMRNFNFPYFSRDIAEFWRRWHISLSTWFRDYVYFPLGGSHGTVWLKGRNIFIVFIISGLWHGANWTFIFWGILNAVYYLPLILVKGYRINMNIVAQEKYLPSFKEFLQLVLTFAMVVFGWIFFRADNLHHAISYIAGILSPTLFTMPEFYGGPEILKSISLLILLFVLIEWLGRESHYAIEHLVLKWRKPFRYAFYYALIVALFWFGRADQQFIYFQF